MCAAPPRPSRRAVLIVMCAGYFLVLLDVTIVNVALPSIGAGLGAGVGGLQWIVDAYALALASLLLAAGTAGDRFGHKPIVVLGLVLFGLASLGCGLAPDPAVLVGFRAVQGVGGACMVPGTLAVISRAHPRERARAIGVWAAVGGAALPAGPLLGGTLIGTVGWRGIFLVNVPIALLAAGATARLVDAPVDRAAARRLDVPGVVLGAAGLAAGTYALVGAGGRTAGIGAGAAAIAVAAFLGVEHRRPDPVLPLSLLRQGRFLVPNAVAATMNAVTLGLLFVLTLYLQEVRHLGALRAGIDLLPLFAPLSVLAPAAGRLAGRAGPRVPMVLGCAGCCVGVVLLARLGSGTSYRTLLPALVLWGAGLGLLTPAVVAAAVGSVPLERAGLAAGVNNSARQAAGALGVAAFGAAAGPPGGPGFLPGLHLVAAVGGGLFAAAALAVLIQAGAAAAGRRHPGRSSLVTAGPDEEPRGGPSTGCDSNGCRREVT